MDDRAPHHQSRQCCYTTGDLHAFFSYPLCFQAFTMTLPKIILSSLVPVTKKCEESSISPHLSARLFGFLFFSSFFQSDFFFFFLLILLIFFFIFHFFFHSCFLEIFFPIDQFISLSFILIFSFSFLSLYFFFFLFLFPFCIFLLHPSPLLPSLALFLSCFISACLYFLLSLHFLFTSSFLLFHLLFTHLFFLFSSSFITFPLPLSFLLLFFFLCFSTFSSFSSFLFLLLANFLIFLT
ncbi:unnamed protein product [Acanthosepion pharaonis]|uniref:Uncharacterized protein n=1 Tax=Acanthosepion pharaonis TaxID=158019 RepID=A0A812DLK1_ACAPH|nr:unnamed protein product [Sepia pharaonis]